MYDTLQQSAGADAATSYVSTQNHLIVVSRGNVLSGDDYQAASQVTAGEWAEFGFDMRSFVQQQDHYLFYAVPILDIPPGETTPPDSTTDLIPPHTPFAVTRRLGKAYGQVKLPKLPVHLFVNGDWQARAGVNQFAYLDENVTTSCGEQCHYQSQLQRVNYTTRNIGGGADVDLGPVRLTWEHTFSSFNDRLVFPTGTFGQFTPVDEPPPPPIPVPPAVAARDYPIDIPSPNEASSDRLNLNWVASPTLTFNGNVSYTRLRNRLTSYPQNAFDTDETASWLPLNRLRVTADYHQQNLINDFTPVYDLFGNVSYHHHWEGLRAEYELPLGFNVDAYYRHSGITRSNAFLWPQGYSFDNTDLLTVAPSSASNTVGIALRYHDRGLWSARAGYEWTGTHDPGYLVVPRSNNRILGNVTFTPRTWLMFANDTNIVVQNAFAAIPLLRSDGTGLSGDFQRRNHFYFNTTSATLRVVPAWNLGLGYSYQQNNLTSYMAFQNDSAAGYVFNQAAVPYKQISQTYWTESSYSFKERFGAQPATDVQLGAQRFPARLESERRGTGRQRILDFARQLRHRGAFALLQSKHVCRGARQPGLQFNPDLGSDRSPMDRAVESVLCVSAQVRRRTHLLLRQLSGPLESEFERGPAHVQPLRWSFVVITRRDNVSKSAAPPWTLASQKPTFLIT